MKFRFVICVALAACGDHELEKLKLVRDEVCACKTVACAETAMKKVPSKDVKSTSKSQAVAREMLNCLAERYEADRPTLETDEATPP